MNGEHRRPGDGRVSIAPALLDVDQAAQLFGVSPRLFHTLRGAEWMPRPIVLGPRTIKFARVELEAAVAAMPRQSTVSEPLQLAKRRAATAGTTEVAS